MKDEAHLFSANPYRLHSTDLAVALAQHSVLIHKAMYHLDQCDDRNRTKLDHFVEECQEFLTELTLDDVDRQNVISELTDVLFTGMRLMNFVLVQNGQEPVKLVDVLSASYHKLSQPHRTHS